MPLALIVDARTAAPALPEPLGRRFGFLFTATGLSNLVDGILLVGVPLLALTLTTSPLLISLISASLWLPWLLCGIVAGVVVDRGDRRRIVLVALVARAVLLAGGAVAALTGVLTMPLLLAIVLVFGLTEVFGDNAAGAMVPSLVPRSRLASANGRLLGAQQVANSFLGAPVAGLLVALGAAWLFGTAVLLCVAAMVAIASGVRGVYRARGDAQQQSGAATEVREGLAFLFGHPVLRPMALVAAVMNGASTAYFAVFVLWVVGQTSAVGLAPEHFGLLVATLAVGAIVGATVAERLANRFEETHIIKVCWVTNAALLAVPVLVPHVVAIGAAFMVVGFTNAVGNVVSMSLRQRLIPDALRGRVAGASATIAYGMMPLGALLGGVVGDTFGLPAVFLGAVAVALAAVTHLVMRVRAADVATFEAAAEAGAVAPVQPVQAGHPTGTRWRRRSRRRLPAETPPPPVDPQWFADGAGRHPLARQ